MSEFPPMFASQSGHTTHFDDCGCKSKRLEAERDALRLRVASLEAALLALCGDGIPGEWPDDDDEVPKGWETWTLLLHGAEAGDHLDGKEAHKHLLRLIGGDTTALRAMLVEAAKRGSTNDGLNNKMHTDAECEAIADRILGASKEGGE